MTYIDQLKYDEFSSDPGKWLSKVKVVNFDIINHERNPLQGSYRNYGTIVNKDFNKYPKEQKTKAVSIAFRNKRKEMWVQHNLMIELFKSFNFKFLGDTSKIILLILCNLLFFIFFWKMNIERT